MREESGETLPNMNTQTDKLFQTLPDKQLHHLAKSNTEILPRCSSSDDQNDERPKNSDKDYLDMIENED